MAGNMGDNMSDVTPPETPDLRSQGAFKTPSTSADQERNRKGQFVKSRNKLEDEKSLSLKNLDAALVGMVDESAIDHISKARESVTKDFDTKILNLETDDDRLAAEYVFNLGGSEEGGREDVDDLTAMHSAVIGPAKSLLTTTIEYFQHVLNMKLNPEDILFLRINSRKISDFDELVDKLLANQVERAKPSNMMPNVNLHDQDLKSLQNGHYMNVENIEKITNLKDNFLDKDFQKWKQSLSQSRTLLPAGSFLDIDLLNFLYLSILEDNNMFKKETIKNCSLEFLEPYLIRLSRDLPCGPAVRGRISAIAKCGPTVRDLKSFIIAIQSALEKSPEEVPVTAIWKKLISKLRNNDSKGGEDRINWIEDKKQILTNEGKFDKTNIDSHILLLNARYVYELEASKVIGALTPYPAADNTKQPPKKDGTNKPPTKRVDKPTDVCWNCGKLGHNTFNCTSINQKTRVPNPGYPNKEGIAAKEVMVAKQKLRQEKEKAMKVGAMKPSDAPAMVNAIGQNKTSYSETIDSLTRQVKGGQSTSGYSKPMREVKPFTENTRINGEFVEVGLDTKAHAGNWICPLQVKRLKLRVMKAEPKVYGSPLGGTFTSTELVKVKIKFLRFKYTIEIEARIFPKGSTMIDPILIGQDDIKKFDLIIYHLLADTNQLDKEPEDKDKIMEQINIRILGENDLWRIGNSKLNLEAQLVAQLSSLDPNSEGYEACLDMTANDMISLDFPDEHRDDLKHVLIKAMRKGVITDKLDGSTMNAPPFSVPFRDGASFEGVPPRQYSLAKTEVIRAWLEKLLHMKIIQPSVSKTTSPVHVVQQDGKYRVTIDDRLLNEKLVRAHGSIPELKQVVDSLGSHEYYGSFDLLLAYYQVSAAPHMRELFAFSTPFGNYEFTNSLPMGEKNIPSHFSSCMREILSDLPASFPSYFDDVFTYGNNATEFIHNVELLLDRFFDKNVKISASKINVGSREINALGYSINKDGYKPKQVTIDKLSEMDFPDAGNLRTYLGLVNVFSGFVKDLPSLTAPFKEVRKKGAHWVVTNEMKLAHLRIRDAIAKIPRLHFLDTSRDIYMECDSSDYGIGSILYQLNDKDEKQIVRIYSSTFNDSAMKWTTIQKEAYAIIKSIMAYESLIDGRNITIKTDHRNLLWMSKIKNPMIARWYEYLLLFDIDIIHIPGDKNVYADALSRLHMNIQAIPPNTVSSLNAIDMKSKSLGVIENSEGDNEKEEEEKFKELFDSIHNAINGHYGVDYTIDNLIEAGVDRKNLRQKVIKLISECATCIKSRGRLSKMLKERHSITASSPFSIFEMDFLQSLPVTDSGNEHMLVLIDSFTRFIYLYPCQSTNGEAVKEALLHVYGYFGTPTHLRTDNAQAFLSEGFRMFREAIETTHNTTVPRHPESHGQVEVANSQVIRHLKNILQDIATADNNNWDKFAPVIANIMNNKVHAATGYSPFNLMYGSEHTLRHSGNDLCKLDLSNADEYLRKLNQALGKARNYAAASQDFLTISNYEKAPMNETEFKVGDYVLYPNPRTGDSRKKAAMKMVGPYLIVDSTDSKEVFRIKDTVQDKFIFAHSNSFIKFKKPVTPSEALNIAAKDYGEYRFDVLDHIGNPKIRSSIYLKVQWQDDKQKSWISLSTCKDVDVVRKYFSKIPDFKSVCVLPDLQPKTLIRERRQAEKLGEKFDNS